MVVTRRGRRLRLVKRLGSGGEGTVYLTDDPAIVCKVYAPERVTEGLLAKLELMVSRPILHPGVCWPRGLIYALSGEFVGYAMSRAEGKELQETVFVGPGLTESFPHWARRDLVTLAIAIVESIEVLHSRNVLLGDINGMNILVKEAKTVCFVDTDSYQVEDHACPVGCPAFVAPELQGVNLRTRLRTAHQENYAVATLVFMILMCGKPPYACCGGEDPGRNVRRRHFSYPLGDRRSRGVPRGPWRYIWSHFPRFLKEMFDGVFSRDERPDASHWKQALERYGILIDRGHSSNELFPAGFKEIPEKVARASGGHQQPCAECGRVFWVLPSWKQRYCGACGEKTKSVRCAVCGREFRAKLRELPRTHLCRECIAPEAITCRECGKSFIFAAGEKSFYAEKGFSAPKRCPDCRKRMRESV